MRSHAAVIRILLRAGFGSCLCFAPANAQAQASPPAGSSGASSWTAATSTIPGGGSAFAAGNLVLNGDFENHLGSGCQSNLTNASFNSSVPSVVAYGGAGEIDLYSAACYGLPAPSGTTKVGLHRRTDGTSDEVALELSSPVSAGDSCTLDFEAQSVTDFDPNLGVVEVGISSVSTSFGTHVYTGTLTAATTWQHFHASFLSPLAGNYVTIRLSAPVAWVHLDAISLRAFGGTSFCAGDGTGAACPCGNTGAAGHGCGSSTFAGGAQLVGVGSAGVSSSTDTLALRASDISGPGLFFQGTAGLTGASFGDGLLCLGGQFMRLGIVFPSGGVATYPGGLTPNPIHVAGGPLTAGDVRHYQCWYREALTFCSPLTYNLTQGLTITWG